VDSDERLILIGKQLYCMSIEFHRLEHSKNAVKPPFRSHNVTQRIICTFKIDRLGIVQVVGKNEINEEQADKNIDMNLSTTSDESNLKTLTEFEQEYIKSHMTSVLLLVFYPDMVVN